MRILVHPKTKPRLSYFMSQNSGNLKTYYISGAWRLIGEEPFNGSLSGSVIVKDFLPKTKYHFAIRFDAFFLFSLLIYILIQILRYLMS